MLTNQFEVRTGTSTEFVAVSADRAANYFEMWTGRDANEFYGAKEAKVITTPDGDIRINRPLGPDM